MTKIATVGDVVDMALLESWEEGDVTGQLGTNETYCPRCSQLKALRLGGSSGKTLTITGNYDDNQLVKKSDITVPEAITYISKKIYVYFVAPQTPESNLFTAPYIFNFQYYINDELQKTIGLPDQTLDPSDEVTNEIDVNIPESYVDGQHRLEISYSGNEDFDADDIWVSHNINDGDYPSYNGSSATVIWHTFNEDSVQINIHPKKRY